MKTLITAFAAGALVLAVVPVQAQSQAQDQGTSSSSASLAPQSQALTDLETNLMANVTAGDTAYDKASAAVNAKADASAICPDLQTAYTAYLMAYNQFQGVLDGIDADTVLPADVKPGEKDSVNNLWDEIEFYLEDIEDLSQSYSCSLT